MQIHFQKPSRERGSVLVITLTLGVLLLVGLCSYLMLVTTQKNIVTRSQTWNAGITMAEAGVEEALAQANSGALNFTNSGSTNMNFGNNGWTAAGGAFFMSNGLSGGTYAVSIQTNTSTPTIYSTGYTWVPISGSIISRIVKVTTTRQALLNVGIGAVGNIDFNGNGVATDSYNSYKTNLSTLGQYDSTKTSTNGNIASEGGLIDLGNHTIQGNEYLGPGATNNNNGTVTGKIYYDYNVEFPDVSIPTDANSWSIANTTNISGTPTYVFRTSGNYRVLSDRPVVVNSNVVVNLNVTAPTFGPSSILIHGGITDSGTARFFINGPTAITITGNTAVDASNRPENLWFLGLPSLTGITYSGTSMFIGVIYAPQAAFTLNGGGNASGVQGSAVVGSISMNGHYNFHYDESLATRGPTRGYVASSWLELY